MDREVLLYTSWSARVILKWFLKIKYYDLQKIRFLKKIQFFIAYVTPGFFMGSLKKSVYLVHLFG